MLDVGKFSFLDVLLVGIGLIHLIPFVIAFARGHSQKWFVLLVSFLPFVGFFVALVWAVIGKAEKSKVEGENA